MFSWIQIIFYILINAPKLISMINQIIEFINGLPKSEQAAAGLKAKEMLTEAIKEHKKSKNDDVIKGVCKGIGCPMQLVSE